MTFPVTFVTKYETGRDPEDWVELAPKGKGSDKVSSWHRVRKLVPPENVDEAEYHSVKHQAMLARWHIIGPAYEAWKKGQAIPENGTPLAAWPALNASQVAALRKLNILTVEDVRDMADSAAAELRWPGARQLPQLAAAYLGGVSTAEKDKQILEMQERMEAMEAMLAEALAAKPAEAEAPKRRGRPPKDVEVA